LSGKVIQFIGAHEKAGLQRSHDRSQPPRRFRFGRKTILVDAAFDKPRGQEPSPLPGEPNP
jgi:hypothetical protein